MMDEPDLEAPIISVKLFKVLALRVINALCTSHNPEESKQSNTTKDHQMLPVTVRGYLIDIASDMLLKC